MKILKIALAIDIWWDVLWNLLVFDYFKVVKGVHLSDKASGKITSLITQDFVFSVVFFSYELIALWILKEIFYAISNGFHGDSFFGLALDSGSVRLHENSRAIN